MIESLDSRCEALKKRNDMLKSENDLLRSELQVLHAAGTPLEDRFAYGNLKVIESLIQQRKT